MNILCFQKLCDIVCDLLLEESNIQPVFTPVTVCGDIHGQVCYEIKYALSCIRINYKTFGHKHKFSAFSLCIVNNRIILYI